MKVQGRKEAIAKKKLLCTFDRKVTEIIFLIAILSHPVLLLLDALLNTLEYAMSYEEYKIRPAE